MRRFLARAIVTSACASIAFQVHDAEAGTLPREQIQSVMRASSPQFQRCFAEAIRRTPGANGRVNVRFVIAPDGSVSHVSEDPGTDFPDAPARKCVLDEVAKLKFPPPEGGPVTVVYPIVFRSTESETSDVTRDQIRAVVRAHIADAKRCYTTELARDPSLKGGTVTVRWSITSAGTVVGAFVLESTLHNARVEQCVTSVVSALQFPFITKMTNVEGYPFTFSP